MSTTTFDNDNKKYDLEDEVDDDDEVKQKGTTGTLKKAKKTPIAAKERKEECGN